MNTDCVSAMSHLSTHETVGKLALPVAGLVDHALIKGALLFLLGHIAFLVVAAILFSAT